MKILVIEDDAKTAKFLKKGLSEAGDVVVFAGEYQKPDSEHPDAVNHMIWYEATNSTPPIPGDKKVRPASDPQGDG